MRKALEQKIENAKKTAEELREMGYLDVTVDEKSGEITIKPKKKEATKNDPATA